MRSKRMPNIPVYLCQDNKFLNECVQIDESLLQGKRKYNRSRILLSVHKGVNLMENNSSNSYSDPEYIPHNNRNRNYGKRV